MTPDTILHGISHANLLLYAAAIPPIEADTTKLGGERRELDWGGPLDGNNPDNFTHINLPEE